ncbi:Gp49 family protein [Limnobacter sp. P1]|uniref:Gp49 family protein n=1 Tax=Limnobacter olei TaxID=3031298 RepID=UPI0023AF61E0|nr:Gp49 family protein [Limnobacter sp. P1]
MSNKFHEITNEYVEASVASEHYFTAYEGAKYGRITRDEPQGSESLKLLTLCVLVLRNGLTSLGANACLDPSKHNPEHARALARDVAIHQAKGIIAFHWKDMDRGGK